MHFTIDTISNNCLRKLVTGVINGESEASKATSVRKEWASSS